jgi:hypothetical protein
MRPKTVRRKVKLESLRSTTKSGADGLYYDLNRFLVKDFSAISHDTIKLLLEIMPLIVTAPPRVKTYQVIFGSRLFNIAAEILEPTYEITVDIIQDEKKNAITKLRYLDLAVYSVLESLSISAAETYELINVPELLPEMWKIPTKATFADMLDVSRSLVSTKPTIKKTITKS